MANKPENLKPFKKGYDPRRHKGQKGEISYFKRFKDDYLAYQKEEEKKGDKEVRNDLMKKVEGWAKKNPKLLETILHYIYGKPQDSIDITTKGEKIESNLLNVDLAKLNYEGLRKFIAETNSAKRRMRK